MKILKLIAILSLLCTISCKQESDKKKPLVSTDIAAVLPADTKGKVIIHENFKSEHVIPRNVEVFLPDGYDTNSKKKYNVLYMHDGQNVFNSKTSYTGIDWGVDEAIDSLIKLKKIKNTIVVAPWNTVKKRFSEYMPEAPAEATSSAEVKAALKQNTGFDDLYSDEYLKFLVEELKPFIDKTYNVYTTVENTAIMGSSMGGLISLYAICKYPKVFGAAGCVSTHWPVPVLGEAYMKTLPSTLPDPKTHKIYFDFGTETLDAQYEPYQKQVDQMMLDKGYKKGVNWITKKFEGASHDEKSWNERIHIPLEFLLQ
ncbi:Predicted hydrolase of the alpha/beta superfamily [Aquimarina amphilecti]|uniref:Predicted hydrolase of the alpha/beta superfamily n=1 Tax=Aquimarina amphilecti TaxID=1038014 RepID=A0A1H7Q4Z0_AQUAM|nr:alpha/beta hydrolase-fold protein [Aquimarina amphilecti]SEL43150.1 Predicted hydrolase of the alpha/beta superfamily [Aquimarina amphilecti]